MATGFRRSALALFASIGLAASMSAVLGAQQSWDKRIDVPERFQVLAPFGGMAVLDKETGLVWERVPGNSRDNWANAFSLCYFKSYGGRKGWRLPKVDELASLLDPAQSGPALPPKHPFDVGRDMIFWTANTYAVPTQSVAYVIDFAPFGGAFYGRLKDPVEDDPREPQLRVWCVRAPAGTADGM